MAGEHVKTGQANRTAGDVDKGDKHAQQLQGFKGPTVGDDCWGHAEGDEGGEGVELDPKFALCAG